VCRGVDILDAWIEFDEKRREPRICCVSCGDIVRFRGSCVLSAVRAKSNFKPLSFLDKRIFHAAGESLHFAISKLVRHYDHTKLRSGDSIVLPLSISNDSYIEEDDGSVSSLGLGRFTPSSHRKRLSSSMFRNHRNDSTANTSSVASSSYCGSITKDVPLNVDFVVLTASTSHKSHAYSISTQSKRIANLEDEILSGIKSASSVATLKSCALPALLDVTTGDDDSMHRTISSVCLALSKFCKCDGGVSKRTSNSNMHVAEDEIDRKRAVEMESSRGSGKKNKITRTLSHARKFLPSFLCTQKEHNEFSELREIHIVAPSRHAAEILLEVCESTFVMPQDDESDDDEDRMAKSSSSDQNKTDLDSGLTSRARTAAILKMMRDE